MRHAPLPTYAARRRAQGYLVPALCDSRGRSKVKFSEHKIDRVDVHGPIAWAAGQYTVTIPSKEGGTTQVNGAWLHVLKQEGAVWNIQAASFTRVNQPRNE